MYVCEQRRLGVKGDVCVWKESHVREEIQGGEDS